MGWRAWRLDYNEVLLESCAAWTNMRVVFSNISWMEIITLVLENVWCFGEEVSATVRRCDKFKRWACWQDRLPDLSRKGSPWTIDRRLISFNRFGRRFDFLLDHTTFIILKLLFQFIFCDFWDLVIRLGLIKEYPLQLHNCFGLLDRRFRSIEHI